uniref:collagen alpha-1(I) chain-like n=1 Tax=Halichoerus grypus TaxID=9711 RepID=UPI001659301F|nr:collagen alpha-1(I) chain-like [Halichoerus grypus]
MPGVQRTPTPVPPPGPPTSRRDQIPAPGGPGRRPHSAPGRLRGAARARGRQTPPGVRLGSAPRSRALPSASGEAPCGRRAARWGRGRCQPPAGPAPRASSGTETGDSGDGRRGCATRGVISGRRRPWRGGRKGAGAHRSTLHSWCPLLNPRLPKPLPQKPRKQGAAFRAPLPTPRGGRSACERAARSRGGGHPGSGPASRPSGETVPRGSPAGLGPGPSGARGSRPAGIVLDSKETNVTKTLTLPSRNLRFRDGLLMVLSKFLRRYISPKQH